jgi:hypothetical protein
MSRNGGCSMRHRPMRGSSRRSSGPLTAFRGVLSVCLYVNNTYAVLAVPSSIASSLMSPYQQFDAVWQQSGWDVRQGNRVHVPSLGLIRACC